MSQTEIFRAKEYDLCNLSSKGKNTWRKKDEGKEERKREEA